MKITINDRPASDVGPFGFDSSVRVLEGELVILPATEYNGYAQSVVARVAGNDYRAEDLPSKDSRVVEICGAGHCHAELIDLARAQGFIVESVMYPAASGE